MADVEDPTGEANPQVSEPRIVACAIGLVLTVGLLGGALAPLGYWWYGVDGLWAVATAGGLCIAAGLMAVLVHKQCCVHGQAVVGVLAATVIRLGIPLCVCLLLAIEGKARSLSGFVYYLLIFYMATLAVETWYSLPSPVDKRRVAARK